MYTGNATYKEIKEWILTKYNVKVSSLYVAQVKAKHGLEMRDCYNRLRSENSRQPHVYLIGFMIELWILEFEYLIFIDDYESYTLGNCSRVLVHIRKI